tara:strand:+ start:1156 stop:1374 length:219 start_codon:yes stop_codon:yes gene_type:complete
MKVGDLVIRKPPPKNWKNQPAAKQRDRLGFGFVMSKQMSGRPAHPCITVFYPKVGESWDIAESQMEIVSESR